jgi:hypothetical protein
MRRTEHFSLAPLSVDSSDAELLRDGRACASRIEGRVLEAELELEVDGGELSLLFVTAGTPHEEVLHIYLIDVAGRVLEHEQLGGPYAPGLLANLEVISDRELRFEFQGSRRLLVRERAAGLLRRRRLQVSPGRND